MSSRFFEEIWDLVKALVQAFAIVFFVKTFFFQPFNIPSASMYPSLRIGDYIFVNKLSYGYSRYSFNFSLDLFGRQGIVSCCPLEFPGRKILDDVPERGDIAVFKFPSDTKIDYIKRIIGLPGDRIQVKAGVLYINDQAIQRERVEDFLDPNREAGFDVSVPQFRETLPNGISYTVLDAANIPMDDTDVYTVPEGHYFAMGDNRDNSQDSRYLDRVGFIPIENFVGKAKMIFMSYEPDASLFQFWNIPFKTRFARFFKFL